MTGKVKIVLKKKGHEVFVDGKPLENIVRAGWEIAPGCVDVLKLTILAHEGIEFEENFD